MKPAFMRSGSSGSQLNGWRPVRRTRAGCRGTHSSGVLRSHQAHTTVSGCSLCRLRLGSCAPFVAGIDLFDRDIRHGQRH